MENGGAEVRRVLTLREDQRRVILSNFDEIGGDGQVVGRGGGWADGIE